MPGGHSSRGHPELDEALDVAASIADRLEEGTDELTLVITRAARTRIAAFRGQVTREEGSLNWLESTSRGAGAPEYAVIGLVSSSLARAVLGQQEASTALLAEVDATPNARAIPHYATYLPAMVRTALTVASPHLALRLSDGVEPRNPLASHALLGHGRALIELGRATEAAEPLRQAREIFHGLQAAPALTETDLVLHQTGLLSA